MQSRRASLIEVTINTAIGFIIALISTALVLPLFGLPTNFGQSFGITAVFTGISVARGYLVRRMFARGAASAKGQGRCHYHVDRCATSCSVLRSTRYAPAASENSFDGSENTMITLAFYKGQSSTFRHRLQDGIVRAASGGQYSHVEMIAGAAELDQLATCLSASARDGGVRQKTIHLKPDHWDLVQLDIRPDAPCAFIRARIGARYDYIGILFSQVLAFGRHNKSRWFCSEICAAALGLKNTQRLSPQMLFEVVTWDERSGA